MNLQGLLVKAYAAHCRYCETVSLVEWDEEIQGAIIRKNAEVVLQDRGWRNTNYGWVCGPCRQERGKGPAEEQA